MTVVRRLRRLLHEMTTLEQVVYATGTVGYFVLGLVYVPWFYGTGLEILNSSQFTKVIGWRLGDGIPFDNPFVVAVVAVVATLAAATAALQMAFIVRLVPLLASIGTRVDAFYRSIGLPAFGKWPELILLFFIKLGVLVSPGLTCGCVAAMALGWLGVYETPRGLYAFHAIVAWQSFWGGVAGIATMLYTPEYEHALPRLIAEFGRILKP